MSHEITQLVHRGRNRSMIYCPQNKPDSYVSIVDVLKPSCTSQGITKGRQHGYNIEPSQRVAQMDTRFILGLAMESNPPESRFNRVW